MPEGWHNDDYLTLFATPDVEKLSVAYGLSTFLPGYRLIGLRGWDDFIVADASGATFTVPTVPLLAQHLAPYEVPPLDALAPDPRLTGKIKWYVKPIVFGGSPELDDNVVWIEVHQHIAAVKWFNELYQSVRAGGPPA